MSTPPDKVDIHSEAFLHSLMRRQLKLSIACAGAFLVALLGLPLLNYFFPETMATRVWGFTLTWFVLGVAFFPFVWVIAYFFIKRSIALEDQEVAEVAAGEDPRSKIQDPDKHPTPRSNGSDTGSALGLMFGAWSFFGSWILVFGA